MSGYYDKYLSSDKLKKVYELAPPRTKQYLKAEIDFVLSYIKSTDSVMELGCGYGRVLRSLAGKAKAVFGIDSSSANIEAAKKYLFEFKNIQLDIMNAAELKFDADFFDTVVCIQNGISAFHVDPEKLISESLRTVKNNGLLLFSSYSDKFWDDRLEWFKIQSKNQLLGEIDWEKTKNGTIICKDGFSAQTYNKAKFEELMSKFDLTYEIIEVDNSSLFCVIRNSAI